MIESPNGYVIPARPQITVNRTDADEVSISICAIDQGAGLVHHDFVLAVDTAKDFVRALNAVIMKAEMFAQL